MPDYRRARHPGGIYFFTLTLLRRRDNDLLTRHIEELREAVRRVRRAHPFDIHGGVVLPDHLHCVVQLPEGNTDFTLRLRLIKSGFSKSLPRTDPVFRNPSRGRNGSPRYASGAGNGVSGSAGSGNT